MKHISIESMKAQIDAIEELQIFCNKHSSCRHCVFSYKDNRGLSRCGIEYPCSFNIIDFKQNLENLKFASEHDEEDL